MGVPATCLGIVGAGAMGQGIAQVAAVGGLEVRLLDARWGGAQEAKDAVKKRLARLVDKGELDAEAARAATDSLAPVAETRDLADCDVVVEAVVEDLAVKRSVFGELESVVGEASLLVSNTSSIPIAAIASACRRPERVAGLHFFNPVPLMRLVEVVRAPLTAEATVARLVDLARQLTRTPVVVRDGPGFLVNLGGRAFTTEGLRLVQEGVATPSEIDAIMRDACGFRMGPFELMDLTGIDVNYPATMAIYEGHQHDPRLKTTPAHGAMLDAGLLGRKTGQGWFAYGDGAAVRPSPDYLPAAEPMTRVALAAPDAKLERWLTELGLEVAADDGRRAVLAAPVGDDATHTAVATGSDYRRLVAVDLTFDTSSRVTVMTAPGVDSTVLDGVVAALVRTDRRVTAIHDSPGFVAQRMAAMIANLGCAMAETGLASPADIDLAMRLGLNYPRGPLELADTMGPATCLHVLERLQGLTGDDRYRPTLWLRRRAALGLSARTPA